MGDRPRAAGWLRNSGERGLLAGSGAGAGPPAGRLGYRIACWRGDWLRRHQAAKRTELVRNLRQVLGDELSPAAGCSR